MYVIDGYLAKKDTAAEELTLLLLLLLRCLEARIEDAD
jgi:hypothetical protein